MNKAQKISHGNLKAWEKKRKAFLKTKPRCSICNKKLRHYTKTKKCPKCRAKKHTESFSDNHPDYQKEYQRKRWADSSK